MRRLNFVLGIIFSSIALLVLLFSVKQKDQPEVLPLATVVATPTTIPQVNLNIYPNHDLTPGDIFAVTAKEVCVKGYTATVRNVSVVTKRKVYEEYGLSYPQPTGDYEADHFIPLELGGSNDIKNLWPEPANPKPGFHEKDIVENYLHSKVCKAEESLTDAQNEIKTDWYKVYQGIQNPKDYVY